MRNFIHSVYQIISTSDKRVYYIGKKSTFVFCFLTALSYFFPTQHNGDIIDIIWSNLYWAGPILALSSFTLMVMAAWQEHKSRGF